MILSRDFYNRSTLTVARELIGARLVRILEGQKLVGLITETEAYISQKDLACHAKAGLTQRTAVMFGEAGHADYASAKAGMAFGLTRTAKNEIARIAPHTKSYCGGRVNCVCPGWTVVPRTKAKLRDETTVRRVTATMALPQIARPDDIAHAVVFVSSDRLARHITGQTLIIAGGMEGRWLWRPDEVDATIA